MHSILPICTAGVSTAYVLTSWDSAIQAALCYATMVHLCRWLTLPMYFLICTVLLSSLRAMPSVSLQQRSLHCKLATCAGWHVCGMAVVQHCDLRFRLWSYSVQSCQVRDSRHVCQRIQPAFVLNTFRYGNFLLVGSGFSSIIPYHEGCVIPTDSKPLSQLC